MERILHTVFIAGVAAMLFGSTGCEQALFPPNLPRSQYERFTYQREGMTAEQQESAMGGTEIDLRSRLKPLGAR
jgi:hypothetical protein